MSIFALPSFIAILMKIFFAAHFRQNFRSDSVLALLFLSLLTLNVIEFCSFFVIEQAAHFVWLMRTYYAGSILAAVSLLIFCIRLAGIHKPLLVNVLLILGFAIATVCATPGWVVDSVSVIGITATRVPGPLFDIHPTFIALALSLCVYILFYGYRTQKSCIDRRRCLLILIALMPVIAPVLIVLVAMSLGYYINAVTVLSTGTIAFMLCIAAYSERDKVFQLLSLVPLTREKEIASKSKRLSQYLNRCAFDHNLGGHLFQEARAEMEACLVEVSLWAADDNRALAARRLGISRATLVRKARAETSHT